MPRIKKMQSGNRKNFNGSSVHPPYSRHFFPSAHGRQEPFENCSAATNGNCLGHSTGSHIYYGNVYQHNYYAPAEENRQVKEEWKAPTAALQDQHPTGYNTQPTQEAYNESNMGNGCAGNNTTQMIYPYERNGTTFYAAMIPNSGSQGYNHFPNSAYDNIGMHLEAQPATTEMPANIPNEAVPQDVKHCLTFSNQINQVSPAYSTMAHEIKSENEDVHSLFSAKAHQTAYVRETKQASQMDSVKSFPKTSDEQKQKNSSPSSVETSQKSSGKKVEQASPPSSSVISQKTSEEQKTKDSPRSSSEILQNSFGKQEEKHLPSSLVETSQKSSGKKVEKVSSSSVISQKTSEEQKTKDSPPSSLELSQNTSGKETTQASPQPSVETPQKVSGEEVHQGSPPSDPPASAMTNRFKNWKKRIPKSHWKPLFPEVSFMNFEKRPSSPSSLKLPNPSETKKFFSMRETEPVSDINRKSSVVSGGNVEKSQKVSEKNKAAENKFFPASFRTLGLENGVDYLDSSDSDDGSEDESSNKETKRLIKKRSKKTAKKRKNKQMKTQKRSLSFEDIDKVLEEFKNNEGTLENDNHVENGERAEIVEKAKNDERVETVEKAEVVEKAENDERAENGEAAEIKKNAECNEDAEIMEKAENDKKVENEEKAGNNEKVENEEKAENDENVENEEKAENDENVENEEKAENDENVENEEKAENDENVENRQIEMEQEKANVNQNKSTAEDAVSKFFLNIDRKKYNETYFEEFDAKWLEINLNFNYFVKEKHRQGTSSKLSPSSPDSLSYLLKNITKKFVETHKVINVLAFLNKEKAKKSPNYKEMEEDCINYFFTRKGSKKHSKHDYDDLLNTYEKECSMSKGLKLQLAWTFLTDLIHISKFENRLSIYRKFQKFYKDIHFMEMIYALLINEFDVLKDCSWKFEDCLDQVFQYVYKSHGNYQID